MGHKSCSTTFDTKHIQKYLRGRLRKILVQDIYRNFSWKYRNLYEFRRYLSAIAYIEWHFNCLIN